MRSPAVLMITALILINGLSKQKIAGQINESDAKAKELAKPWTDFWIVRLTMNLFGYATVIIPGFIIIVYVRRTNYLDQPGKHI